MTTPDALPSRPLARLWMILIMLPALTLAGGCRDAHHDSRLRDVTMPADFALEFELLGDPASSDPMRQTSRYVLESDRSLRVIAGPAAGHRSYPPLLRRLTPTEQAALLQHIRATNLMAGPTSPGAEATATSPATNILYDVAVTAFSRTRCFRTTPEESPPAVELLARLVALRRAGGK